MTKDVYGVSVSRCILATVRKRTNMNVDMDLVAQVSKILGTKTTTATVHTAMEEMVKLQYRRELVADDLPGLTVEALANMDRGEEDVPNVDLSDLGK